MKVRSKLLVIPVLASLLLFGPPAHSDSKEQQAPKRNSQDNFFKLGVALLQYSDDYDGTLPPMQDAAAAQTALGDFVKDDAAFVQPETKHPYVPNPDLSGRKHAHFNNQQVIAFYEESPAPDGTRWVLFLPRFDSKVIHFESNSGFVKNSIKRLSKSEWLKLKPSTAK